MHHACMCACVTRGASLHAKHPVCVCRERTSNSKASLTIADSDPLFAHLVLTKASITIDALQHMLAAIDDVGLLGESLLRNVLAVRDANGAAIADQLTYTELVQVARSINVQVKEGMSVIFRISKPPRHHHHTRAHTCTHTQTHDQHHGHRTVHHIQMGDTERERGRGGGGGGRESARGGGGRGRGRARAGGGERAN